ncbi:MAG TPA: cytochrome c biogenesis protein CcdC [Polyangiaceae bacterium]|nr:cytochrome c biogenesis protein CcdC [Polyangiaceae bacterium]
MHTAAAIGSLVGAAGVIAWRVRETKRPVSARSILIPPLGMSTGLSMFLVPAARVPWSYAVAAFIAGVLVFAQPLIRTSRLSIEAGAIMLRRSKAFLWVLLGLVAVRFALRSYVEQYVSTLQTGGLFFLLAFGSIVTWRATMYRSYQTLRAKLPPKS